MSTPEKDVRWLSPEEMEAWLGLGAVSYLLPQALDRQLRRDFGISHSYYTILATISHAEEGAICMGALARSSWISPSRLTHAVAKLEERGWVRRSPAPDNRRQQMASLTEAGWTVLRTMAPTHLEEARRTVFDALDAEDVAHLTRISQKLMPVLEAGDERRPRQS